MGLTGGMRSPVVLDNLRVVRGNELSALAEVLHRVAAIVPIGDLAQVLQGVALATARLHLTFVLGSESLLQAGAPTPAGLHYHEDHNRGQHDNTNDDQEDDGVHG